nr:hypothetical protein [Burkholderia ambifaria]
MAIDATSRDPATGEIVTEYPFQARELGDADAFVVSAHANL